MTEATCPSCGFEILTCPSCGYATTFFPRHGKRGSGAHYANRIVKLTPTHELCLEVLKYAIDADHGLDLTTVWQRVRGIRMLKNQRVPTKQGISGRLSELQGLGKVKSVKNNVRLMDSQTQQYRFENRPVWVLNNGHAD